MKNKYIALTLLLAAGLSSCTDSFFDLKPNDQVTVESVYKTASDFKAAVNGCYAKLQTQVNFYTEFCEYRSDNLSLSAPTAGTQDRYDIDQFQEKASNGLVETYWASFDNEVYRCNLVLDKIDAATFSDELKNQYKGEALFMRALSYFNMYRVWGGVPTTNKVVTPTETLSIARSSDDEMYNFIAGDLKNIIDNNLLPESYSDASDKGRATLGAAKALLGKVDLTFGKNQEAADVLATLIGKYKLLSDPAQVFSVDNKLNDEIIFAVQFDKDKVDEGHSNWFGVTNLSDENGQTSTLLNLYSAEDKRADLIKYEKVPNVKLYLMKKFYDTPSDKYNTYGNDQILLRYPDVLLMYAEALNNLGYKASPTSPALVAINQVRERAGLADLAANDVPDQESFKKAILVERQKEFPYEGQRWFDLVRMGYAKEVMAEQGHTINDNQLLFPIPTTELERINNTSILWQNPGY